MSTKYLLNFVDSKPRQAPQLKALVAEARESGVRDEKASFHEFVETLERITQELRSDHNSAAFLSRVKKTEAPDYYDVIKKPMDLGTVLKKVKQGVYKTKAQFREDLDLIWSNCFHYNSHPDHPLRAAASSLRTKAKQLLEFVTDPVASKPAHPSGRATSQHPAGSRHLAGIAAAETRWATRRGVDPSTSLAGTDGAKPKAKVNGVSFADEGGDAEESGPDGAGQEEENVAFEERPALVRTAESMAIFVEAKEAWEAGSVAGPSVPRGLVNGDFSRRSASSRRSRSRSRPRAATDAATTPRPDVAVMEQDPILAEWATFVSPAMFAAGVPVLPLKERSDEDLEIGTPSTPAKGAANGIAKRRPARKGKAKTKGKGKAQADALPTEKQTLAGEMRANIATLRRIGKVHAKIATATATPRIGVDPDAMDEDKSVVDDDEDSDRDEMNPPDLATMPVPQDVLRGEAGVEAGREVMQRAMSMILAHAGFSGVQSTALQCLTEIGTHYLLNLGRTLRFLTDRYSDKPSSDSALTRSQSDPDEPLFASTSTKRAATGLKKGHSMSPEDMLMQTLRQNGCPSLATLRSHVQDDVGRYGGRLKDLERKLVNGFKDIVENGVPGRPVWGDENLFAKDSEAMAMGEFASELGEDFWGLRDLGLDAELGMGSLRIPSRLYHGRPRQGTGPDDPDASGPAKEPRWFVPPAFVPLTPAAIEGQIGLLQPFFRARLENPDFRLLEDQEIPKGKAPKLIRPKVPPSGKIPIRRKQADAMAKSASDEGVNAGTPGKKRKKAD